MAEEIVLGPRPGWKGFDGTLYERFDERLAGYGLPPSDPNYQKANPGAGQAEMQTARIDGGPAPESLVEV